MNKHIATIRTLKFHLFCFSKHKVYPVHLALFPYVVYNEVHFKRDQFTISKKRMGINIKLYNINNLNIANISYYKILHNNLKFTLQTRIMEQQHIYYYLEAEK